MDGKEMWNELKEDEQLLKDIDEAVERRENEKAQKVWDRIFTKYCRCCGREINPENSVEFEKGKKQKIVFCCGLEDRIVTVKPLNDFWLCEDCFMELDDPPQEVEIVKDVWKKNKD